MSAQRIAFRVDASLLIGTGHVMRCLTLAKGLQKKGHQILFLMRNFSGSMIQAVKAAGFETWVMPGDIGFKGNHHCQHGNWLGLPYRDERKQTVEMLAKWRAKLLIIDHYGIDAELEKDAQQVVDKVAVIDDLADRNHDCALLVDQNHGANKEKYAPLVAKSTDLLLGPKYSLLREEFIHIRKGLEPFEKRLAKGQITLFFGGIDRTNETLKALKGITSVMQSSHRISVIAGRNNPHLSDLATETSRLSQVDLHVQVKDLAKRFAEAFLFVGAVGTTTWERSCLGLPAIAAIVADNQRSAAEAMHRDGFQYSIGTTESTSSQDYTNAYNTLITQPDRLIAMNQKTLKLVDGLGCDRVVTALLS